MIHRIPLWAVGPLLLFAGFAGSTNPDDKGNPWVLGIGFIMTLVLTLPVVIELYRDFQDFNGGSK